MGTLTSIYVVALMVRTAVSGLLFDVLPRLEQLVLLSSLLAGIALIIGTAGYAGLFVFALIACVIGAFAILPIRSVR